MTTTSPSLIPSVEDHLDGFLLGLDDDGRATERENRLVDARRLDDAAPDGEVAVQDREAAVGGVRVLDVMDAALSRVGVKRLPPLGL